MYKIQNKLKLLNQKKKKQNLPIFSVPHISISKSHKDTKATLVDKLYFNITCCTNYELYTITWSLKYLYFI